MIKQSCLKCRHFFNVKLFMKAETQSWANSVTHCLLYPDLQYMIGHEENDYECECSRFQSIESKEVCSVPEQGENK